KNSDQTRLIRDICQKPDIVEDPAPLLSEDLAAAASKGQQFDLTRSATYPLVVDRPIARASAWDEMMPRSQSAVFGKHGTEAFTRPKIMKALAKLGFSQS